MILADVPAVALAVFAHPDDPEIACAGTLARWVAGGSAVHLVIVNAGEKGIVPDSIGPADLAAVRAKEADAAAEVMGLAGHHILGVPDGDLENDGVLRETLIGVVRRVKPEVVIAPDPTAVFFGDGYINHHDHRALGWAMLDVVAPMAASSLYVPQAGPAHRVSTLLLAGTLEPDTWVDIEPHLATKVAALRCHASQLGDGSDMAAELVAARAAEAGQRGGVRYAEGFRRIRLA